MSQVPIDLPPVNPSNGVMPAIVESRITTLARNANIISVLTYGAVPDGVTDSTAAIQAAINAAGNSSTVFLPRGKYLVSSTLTTQHDQRIVSASMSHDQGSGGSTEIISTVTSGPTLTLGGGSEVHALRLQGPGATYGGTIGINVPAGSSAFTLRDVQVEGFDTGVYANQIWYGHIHRTHITRNNWGLVLDYCYNTNLVDLKVSAGTTDGVGRGGIWMKNASMATMTGGSLENYQTGIQLDTNAHLEISGTYFETKYGKNANCILLNGKNTNLVAIGCQIYITNSRFISMPAAMGQTVKSYGHKFKGGTKDSTWEMAYYWEMPNSGALRFELGPDNWTSVGGGVPYRPAGVALPFGSSCRDPYAAPSSSGDQMDGTFYFSGSVAMTDSTSLFTIPSGASLPTMAGRAGRVGSMFWLTSNGTNGKLAIWNGSKWVDASGTALS